jgi:hypothetical protein
MLRASLMGVVMGLMCGLVGPAQAQNGANCLERCRTNHCNGGGDWNGGFATVRE